MRHNLAALDFLLRLWKWQTTLNCKMSSSTDILWCYPLNLHYGFEHGLRIYAFRPIWPCLIIEILATWVKFLEPFSYCTIINCTFTYCTADVFGCFCDFMAQFKLVKHISSPIRLHCTFISMAFKSHIEWSNAQYISTLTTIILPSTAGNYHSLNCFTHMICMPQTSTYQNIAKSLTHDNMFI